jgi:hypothetical protein
MLPNPCSLRLNDVTLSVSNAEVVQDMFNAELLST